MHTSHRPIPGGWTERTAIVSEHSFSLLLPAEPDEVLLEVEEQAAQQAEVLEPYWAKLWPTSETMAEILLRRRWPVGTKSLELGCGTGFLGIAGLKAGLDVTLTDYHPDAIALSRENSKRNDFPHARVELLDWRNPPHEQFQFVFASEVIYDDQHHAPILGLLKRVLAPTGECWLGDPGRSAAERFVPLAIAHGFQVRFENETGEACEQLAFGKFRLLRLSFA